MRKMNKDNYVVVTGANGFLGTALCRKLARLGMNVIAIVNKNDNNVKNIPHVKIVYCALSEYDKLSDLLRGIRKIDVFYHLAWAGTSGELRGDVNTQLANIKAACDAVKACSDIGCERFVFAASIMEYEIYAYMQTDSIPAKSTLYSTAKLSADYMTRTIANDFGIVYIRAVISNIYGPGECSARLINTSIRKMLNSEHCAFSLGEQLYDFIYIDDAVEAFLAIGNSGVNNRTYYIGNPAPKKLKEFLYEMRDAVNPDLDIGVGEIPFCGVSLSYDEFDLNTLKQDTGFVTKVDFATGIRKTADWLKEQGNV